MDITIAKRGLTDQEIELLIEEIKKFPNPVAGNKKRWQILNPVYIASLNNQLVGICGITRLKNWIKLGPFIVLKDHHGKGIGKAIMKHIVDDYSKHHLFVGSRNPVIGKIATHFGFKEIEDFWILPNEIKLYLILQIIESFDVYYVQELIRKRPMSEGKYRYFTRT